MAPRSQTESSEHQDVLGLDNVDAIVDHSIKTAGAKRPPTVIVWKNVAIFGFLHVASVCTVFLLPYAKLQTLLFTVFLYVIAILGITAGAHRLWSHRSYKAKLPLRILLAAFNCVAVQNSLYEWARDHRVHHKFSESNADPHNAKRGFFFSHIGWLLVKKHPDVKAKGQMIDLSDLERDSVVMFQKRHYGKLILLFCFILPTVIPMFAWGESAFIAFYVSAIFRYTVTLNVTWLVNSAAHMWGSRPYDERINPSQNRFVQLFALGGGFHNYHHVFPQDYSSSEFGWWLNPSTAFIDLMHKLGQAYDLRSMPSELVERRKARTGEGANNH